MPLLPQYANTISHVSGADMTTAGSTAPELISSFSFKTEMKLSVQSLTEIYHSFNVPTNYRDGLRRYWYLNNWD